MINGEEIKTSQVNVQEFEEYFENVLLTIAWAIKLKIKAGTTKIK